jgi:hypothetical protein
MAERKNSLSLNHLITIDAMDRNRIQSSRSSKTTSPPLTSQTQKLKDSCDKCSSSKVRCTKEKPSCARCDKLGYTCFYSPARRVGRPYRSKEPSSEEKDNEESDRASTKNTPTTRFVDESVRIYSRFNAATSVDASLNSTSSASVIQNNFNPSESNPAKHRDIDPDCVLVALDLFADLEGPAEQLRRASPVDSALLNATAQTITSAFRQLSTILICPCSERAEVGMLVSAMCMSIIDMHVMTIAKFARDQPPPAVLDQTAPWESPGVGPHRSPEHEATAMRVLGELSKVAKLILQFTERYNDGNGSLNRSNGRKNGSELPAGFLPSMATFLRERLQQITNDTTYWLG